MRTRGAVAVVVLVTTLTMLTGYAFAASSATDAEAPLGPGVVTVELGSRYTRFSLDDIRVYEGTLVRFVVTNQDPIHHEFIVGDEAVHRAHEAGNDPLHPPVPGEVSLDPGETGLTTYLFDTPGSVRFACHLQGHLAYGMQGEVQVESA